MKHPLTIKGGYKSVIGRDGKTRIEKLPDYGLSVSARIAKKKKAATPKLKRTR